MEYLTPGKKFKWMATAAIIVTEDGPVVVPFEPITKPKPEVQPITKPDKDDPFNVPAPKVDPTPKGFF